MCTSIKLVAKNGDIFWGRTMDLNIPMFSDTTGFYFSNVVTTLPGGKEIDSQLNNWTSKYTVMGVGLEDTTVLYDGVNEHGLAGDLQVLTECGWAELKDINEAEKTPLIGEEVVSYMLTNYKTVSEIRENFDKFMLVNQSYSYKGRLFHFPVHFSFVDDSGDSIVLETLEDGSFKMFEHLGVMTNSPRYDYHAINIRNYIGMNPLDLPSERVLPNGMTMTPIEGGTGYGMFGLPGDYTSPSRFVRAFCLANTLNSFERNKGMNELYSTFRTVFVPKGLERDLENQSITNYTRYWSGYDLSERTVVVQSGESMAITTKTLDTNTESVTYEEIKISM